MAGDNDPFDLIGQPAEQQLDVPAVTNPAAETASSAERYAPGTWLESPPDVVEERAPARTLGRVRMPTRVVLLAVLPLLLVGTYRYLLYVLEAYEHLTWVWWLIPSALFSAVLFSAMHFSLHLIVPFSVGGLIFGAMYLRTRHLTAPAMAHAGWNLGVTVLLLMEYGVG